MRGLPDSIRVLERGWLSSNNVVFLEGGQAQLVDSGYVTHAEQTVALVRHALAGRALARVINTHSHSDHIGGNAALAQAFGCRIAIPNGIAPAVAEWDESALLLAPAAQSAARFAHDEEIADGDQLELGGLAWRAIAVPGHDMHALAFYNASRRILIPGDALWRNGFGVVFATLVGDEGAFAVTRATLERLSRLAIDIVIPGHGAPFVDVDDAFQRAFDRLAAFEADPQRLAKHAVRVLFSFWLLERRSIAVGALPGLLASVSLYREINDRFFRQSYDELASWLVRDLERAGVVRREEDRVVAASGA